jgi:glutamate carboxypeptidase
MSPLINYFWQRRAGTLSLIGRLVEMETPSRQEAQLNAAARLLADELQPLADELEIIPRSGYGSHLRACFQFGHPADSPHSLVIGHFDTVWPVGTLERRPFSVGEDGLAHGPGIFDMKSGVAIIVEALRAIKEQRLSPAAPLVLLLTCDEEIGSPSSRSLVEAAAARAAAAFVLEPPIPGGIVKTGRKGVGVFTLQVTGRAAHAGLDPAKGVNAVVELAHQIIRVAALNDPSRGVTANVGVVSGGTTSNVVPAEATARIDVRFWTPEDGERIKTALSRLTPVLDGASLAVGGGINRPPMQRSERNLRLYEHARRLAAELDFELQEDTVGGGSDGNFTAALGVPTLDGLGVDGAGAHAEHEHIVVADLPRRAALLTRLLVEPGLR